MNRSLLLIPLLLVCLHEQRCFSLEKRQGTVKRNLTIQCLYQCDAFILDPDPLNELSNLKADGLTSISLSQYENMHVEVTGYQADCGGCIDLIVTSIRILPTVTGVAIDHTALPAGFALEQNYPNPFNPATTIRYDIHARAEVTVSVLDMFGRELARLVSTRQGAGRYSVTWDAPGRPTGLYICRLVAVGEDGTVSSSTVKMLHVR